MRPVALLNDVVVHERRLVVECGTGVSTLYLGALLAQQGGQLVSIDDDASWIGIIEGLVRGAGLTEQIRLVHAPLAPCPEGLGGLPWFAREPIDAALGDQLIDLLVVDGPQAHGHGRALARYPALPVFKSRLAPAAGVFLDDTERAGEREILERWREMLGVSQDDCVHFGGASLILPAPGYRIV